jgi:hypothetical protein
MLSVTEAGRAHLADMLDGAKPPSADSVVRIIYDKSGLSMMIDELRDGDLTFDHEGTMVLAVSEGVVEELGGKTLDVEVGEEGQSLMLR